MRKMRECIEIRELQTRMQNEGKTESEWSEEKETDRNRIEIQNNESTRREFLREIFYKNISIIAIQHGKCILLTPLAIFPILLSEIHSSPSGKFSYTY